MVCAKFNKGVPGIGRECVPKPGAKPRLGINDLADREVRDEWPLRVDSGRMLAAPLTA